jgi:hypothetical protein
MREFIALFAPHWPQHMIEEAAGAPSQQLVDELAAGVILPVRNGCTEGLSIAA